MPDPINVDPLLEAPKPSKSPADMTIQELSEAYRNGDISSDTYDEYISKLRKAYNKAKKSTRLAPPSVSRKPLEILEPADIHGAKLEYQEAKKEHMVEAGARPTRAGSAAAQEIKEELGEVPRPVRPLGESVRRFIAPMEKYQMSGLEGVPVEDVIAGRPKLERWLAQAEVTLAEMEEKGHRPGEKQSLEANMRSVQTSLMFAKRVEGRFPNLEDIKGMTFKEIQDELRFGRQEKGGGLEQSWLDRLLPAGALEEKPRLQRAWQEAPDGSEEKKEAYEKLKSYLIEHREDAMWSSAGGGISTKNWIPNLSPEFLKLTETGGVPVVEEGPVGQAFRVVGYGAMGLLTEAARRLQRGAEVVGDIVPAEYAWAAATLASAAAEEGEKEKVYKETYEKVFRKGQQYIQTGGMQASEDFWGWVINDKLGYPVPEGYESDVSKRTMTPFDVPLIDKPVSLANVAGYINPITAAATWPKLVGAPKSAQGEHWRRAPIAASSVPGAQFLTDAMYAVERGQSHELLESIARDEELPRSSYMYRNAQRGDFALDVLVPWEKGQLRILQATRKFAGARVKTPLSGAARRMQELFPESMGGEARGAAYDAPLPEYMKSSRVMDLPENLTAREADALDKGADSIIPEIMEEEIGRLAAQDGLDAAKLRRQAQGTDPIEPVTPPPKGGAPSAAPERAPVEEAKSAVIKELEAEAARATKELAKRQKIYDKKAAEHPEKIKKMQEKVATTKAALDDAQSAAKPKPDVVDQLTKSVARQEKALEKIAGKPLAKPRSLVKAEKESLAANKALESAGKPDVEEVVEAAPKLTDEAIEAEIAGIDDQLTSIAREADEIKKSGFLQKSEEAAIRADEGEHVDEAMAGAQELILSPASERRLHEIAQRGGALRQQKGELERIQGARKAKTPEQVATLKKNLEEARGFKSDDPSVQRAMEDAEKKIIKELEELGEAPPVKGEVPVTPKKPGVEPLRTEDLKPEKGLKPREAQTRQPEFTDAEGEAWDDIARHSDLDGNPLHRDRPQNYQYLGPNESGLHQYKVVTRLGKTVTLLTPDASGRYGSLAEWFHLLGTRSARKLMSAPKDGKRIAISPAGGFKRLKRHNPHLFDGAKLKPEIFGTLPKGYKQLDPLTLLPYVYRRSPGENVAAYVTFNRKYPGSKKYGADGGLQWMNSLAVRMGIKRRGSENFGSGGPAEIKDMWYLIQSYVVKHGGDVAKLEAPKGFAERTAGILRADGAGEVLEAMPTAVRAAEEVVEAAPKAVEAAPAAAKAAPKAVEAAAETQKATRVASAFSGTGTIEGALPGAKSVSAVELDEKVIAQFNKVHKTAYKAGDVAEIDPAAVAASNPDIFHASPVCKNFSKAKRLATATESDKASADAVVRVITEARPPVVTVENVPAYADTALFKSITDALDAAGYKWEVIIHDAADYGAAQTRKRMLLRAVREGELPPLPAKTEPTDWYKLIEDLIDGAPDDKVGPDELKRIANYVDKGKLTRDQPILTMGASASKGVPYAANAGGPAPTLLASPNAVPRILLPDGRVKRITPRMMARLMGLPDSFPVPEPTAKGAIGFAKQVLGNGIHGEVTRKLIAPLLRRGAAAADEAAPAAARAADETAEVTSLKERLEAARGAMETNPRAREVVESVTKRLEELGEAVPKAADEVPPRVETPTIVPATPRVETPTIVPPTPRVEGPPTPPPKGPPTNAQEAKRLYLDYVLEAYKRRIRGMLGDHQLMMMGTGVKSILVAKSEVKDIHRRTQDILRSAVDLDNFMVRARAAAEAQGVRIGEAQTKLTAEEATSLKGLFDEFAPNMLPAERDLTTLSIKHLNDLADEVMHSVAGKGAQAKYATMGESAAEAYARWITKWAEGMDDNTVRKGLARLAGGGATSVARKIRAGSDMISGGLPKQIRMFLNQSARRLEQTAERNIYAIIEEFRLAKRSGDNSSIAMILNRMTSRSLNEASGTSRSNADALRLWLKSEKATRSIDDIKRMLQSEGLDVSGEDKVLVARLQKHLDTVEEVVFQEARDILAAIAPRAALFGEDLTKGNTDKSRKFLNKLYDNFYDDLEDVEGGFGGLRALLETNEALPIAGKMLIEDDSFMFRYIVNKQINDTYQQVVQDLFRLDSAVSNKGEDGKVLLDALRRVLNGSGDTIDSPMIRAKAEALLLRWGTTRSDFEGVGTAIDVGQEGAFGVYAPGAFIKQLKDAAARAHVDVGDRFKIERGMITAETAGLTGGAKRATSDIMRWMKTFLTVGFGPFFNTAFFVSNAVHMPMQAQLTLGTRGAARTTGAALLTAATHIPVIGRTIFNMSSESIQTASVVTQGLTRRMLPWDLGGWLTVSKAKGAQGVHTPQGIFVTRDQLIQEAMDLGIDRSQMRIENARGMMADLRSADPKGAAQAIKTFGSNTQQMLFTISHYQEMLFRTNVYVAARKAGKAPEECARLARESVFDYGKLSEFERFTVRKYVTFYSFARANFERSMHALVTDPTRLTRQARYMNGQREAIWGQDRREAVGDYDESNKRLIVGWIDKVMAPGGGDDFRRSGMMYGTTPVPLSDFLLTVTALPEMMGSFKSGTELGGRTGTEATAYLLNQLNPFIGRFITAAMGVDPFTGQKVTADQLTRVPPALMWADSLGGQGGAITDFFHIQPRKEDDPEKADPDGYTWHATGVGVARYHAFSVLWGRIAREQSKLLHVLMPRPGRTRLQEALGVPFGAVPQRSAHEARKKLLRETEYKIKDLTEVERGTNR